MLIRFFKSSFYSQYLVLFLITVALWLRAGLSPCLYIPDSPESLGFDMIYGLIGGNNFVNASVAIIILLLNAVLLNFVLIRHELLPKNSLLGALVYVVLMSHSLTALSLNPVLLAGLFIIPAFDQIMLTYGKADPTQQVFSASFLLALASLIYFPAVILLLLLLFSLFIFQTLSFRIFVVAFTGAFAVYLYLFLYYFLSDSMEGQYWVYVEWFSTFPALTLPPIGTIYVIWGLLILLFIAALLHSFSHLNEWNISVRKKMLLNLWFLLLALMSLIFEADILTTAFLLISVPVTLIISSFLANRKKVSLWMETFLIILIAAIFVNNTFIAVC